jgi:hypothetical protein
MSCRHLRLLPLLGQPLAPRPQAEEVASDRVLVAFDDEVDTEGFTEAIGVGEEPERGVMRLVCPDVTGRRAPLIVSGSVHCAGQGTRPSWSSRHRPGR